MSKLGSGIGWVNLGHPLVVSQFEISGGRSGSQYPLGFEAAAIISLNIVHAALLARSESSEARSKEPAAISR
jgi:hypothetical protein